MLALGFGNQYEISAIFFDAYFTNVCIFGPFEVATAVKG